MVRRGTRAEDREAARAALAQAVSAREGAYRAWQDAQAILDKPQELDAKIDDARAQLALSEKQVETAKAQIEMAKTRRDVFNGAGSDEGKTQYLVYDKQVQAAEQALLAAQATRDAAQTSLNALLAMRADPIALRAQVHTAKTQYESAKATADAAQAAFDVIVAGPTVEEVAVAQAQREQAEAALAVLQVQRDKMRLITPVDGLVVEHSVHVGETASVGSTLMTVASLDVVKLTIYVPTDRIGLVRVGQRAEVTVDSFPGRIFVGQVTYISPQAEFTPKNVQTREERVKTVFAVRITLPNPDHSLKPGMSADARALADAGLVPTTTSTP
jgi:multidrug efflux pump subunit AcrA (membrane-fusion protein)